MASRVAPGGRFEESRRGPDQGLYYLDPYGRFG
jgi:hypothetical protein